MHISYKAFCLLLRIILLLFAIPIFALSCSRDKADLSSPEKNHETTLRAFRTNDFDLLLKCFADEKALHNQFKSIAGKEWFASYKRKFFQQNQLLESKIVEKKEMSESEAILEIEDVLEKKRDSGGKYLVKSRTIAKFVRIDNEWKIQTVEIVEMQLFKWHQGQYCPIKRKDPNRVSDK